MKKIIIVVIVAVASTISVIKANETTNNTNMTELQMENIELLAEGEPTEADCWKVCDKVPQYVCDIAYSWDRADFRRCEGFWPK